MGRFCACTTETKREAARSLMDCLSYDLRQLIVPLAIVAETLESPHGGERNELQILMAVLVAHMHTHSMESIVTRYLEARGLALAGRFTSLESNVLKCFLHEIPMWRIVDVGNNEARIVSMHATSLESNFPRFFKHASLGQHLITSLPAKDLLLTEGYFGRLGRAIAANGLREVIEKEVAIQDAWKQREAQQDNVRGLKRLLEPDLPQIATDEELNALDAAIENAQRELAKETEKDRKHIAANVKNKQRRLAKRLAERQAKEASENF